MERRISKEISKGIQIIAVLMMVFHHTFGFPERYMDGISYIGITIGSFHVEEFIGSMCKICVSLFAFGTGYALAHKELTLRYIGKKICSLVLVYWCSLIVFIITKCIDGGHYSLLEIIQNIVLCSFSINNNAWYIAFYIMALFTLFIIQKMKANWLIIVAFVIVCAPVNYLIELNNVALIFSLNSYFIYIPLILLGYYLNSSWFNRIYSVLCVSTRGFFVSLILLVVSLGLRVVTGSEVYGFHFIWIYGPLIYLALAIIVKYLFRYKATGTIIFLCGNYTTEIWLLHGLFTAPILWTQRLCFLPKISILIFVWEIFMTVLLAHVYKAISNWICVFRKGK